MKRTRQNLPIQVPLEYFAAAPQETAKFVRDVLNARKELAIVKEQETTKREAIVSRMRTRLEEISARRETVTFALEQEFGIRQKAIEDLFSKLDAALENGKDDIVIAAVSAIEGIVKTSPIGSALKVLADSFERDDGVIDI